MSITFWTVESFLLLDLFQPIVTFHKETGYLFCSAKQLIGFYMKFNTGLKWVKTVKDYIHSQIIFFSSLEVMIDIASFKFKESSQRI